MHAGSRRRRWLTVLAALLLLLGAFGGSRVAPSVPMVLYEVRPSGSTMPVPVQSLPGQLGLVVPDVPGYTCEGSFTPAQASRLNLNAMPPAVGMPFWQLDAACVDPSLTRLPAKDPDPAHVVLLFEFPSTLANFARNLKDVDQISLGGRPALLGRTGFAGTAMPTVSFVEGTSRWTGHGMRLRRSVLVSLYGRDVPIAVLERFARSLRHFP